MFYPDYESAMPWSYCLFQLSSSTYCIKYTDLCFAIFTFACIGAFLYLLLLNLISQDTWSYMNTAFFLPKLKHFFFFSLHLFALIWSWWGSHGKRWHRAVLWTNQNLAIFGLKSDYSCGGGLLILPVCCQWNLIRPHPRSPDEVNQLTI